MLNENSVAAVNVRYRIDTIDKYWDNLFTYYHLQPYVNKANIWIYFENESKTFNLKYTLNHAAIRKINQNLG